MAHVQKLYTDYRAASTIGDHSTVVTVLEKFKGAVEKFPKCVETYANKQTKEFVGCIASLMVLIREDALIMLCDILNYAVLVGLSQKLKSSKSLAGEILDNPINELLIVTGPARVDHQEEQVGFELVKRSEPSMEEVMVDTDMTDMSMVTSAPIWPESSEQDQEMSEISPRKPSQVTEKYFKTLQVPGTSPAAKKDCLLAE